MEKWNFKLEFDGNEVDNKTFCKEYQGEIGIVKTTLLNTGHSCQQAVYVNANGVFDPNDKTKMIQCANNIRNMEMWQLVFGQRKSKKLTNTLLLEMKSDSEIKMNF